MPFAPSTGASNRTSVSLSSSHASGLEVLLGLLRRRDELGGTWVGDLQWLIVADFSLPSFHDRRQLFDTLTLARIGGEVVDLMRVEPQVE